MNNEWYVIKNLEEFVDQTRILVFNNFGHPDSDGNDIDILLDNIKPEDEEEFNKVLSHEESIIITKTLVKKQKNKKTSNIRYVISDDIFYEIIQSLNDRMVSNLLNSLVNQGLVETAFDEKSNDFIFWIKNDDNQNNKE